MGGGPAKLSSPARQGGAFGFRLPTWGARPIAPPDRVTSLSVVTNLHVVTTIPVLDNADDPASMSTNWIYGGVDIGTDIPTLFGLIVAFYNVAAAGSALSISKYLGQQVDTGAGKAQIKAYDVTTELSGAPHGSPIASFNWTVGTVGGTSPVPSGVAACLSYRAGYAGDVEFNLTAHTRPRSSDRGRFYIGPVDGIALMWDPSSRRVKFTSAFLNDCLSSLKQLFTAATPNFTLAVWSRKRAAMKDAAVGEMDDRPDYQRRRSDPSMIGEAVNLLDDGAVTGLGPFPIEIGLGAPVGP